MFKLITSTSGLRSLPVFNAETCTRNTASGCSSCVTACPFNALVFPLSAQPDSRAGKQWNAPPTLVYDQCVGCGICAAQCPVGAIDRVGPEPEQLVLDVADRQEQITTSRRYRKAVKRAVALQTTDQQAKDRAVEAVSNPPYRVQMVCDQVEASLVEDEAIRITCIGAINPETLVACANALDSSGQLELVTKDCANCPINAAGNVAAVCQSANEMVNASAQASNCVLAGTQNRMGAANTIVMVQAAPKGISKLFARRKSAISDAAVVSRRDLFAGFAKAVQQTKPVERKRPRDLLLESTTKPALPMVGATGESCSGCNACVQVCPTKALKRGTEENAASGEVQTQLMFTATNCVDCNECIRVCASGSLTMLDRSTDGGGQQIVLTMAESQNCEVCKQELPPGEQSPCSNCAACSVIGSSIWDLL